MCLCTAQIYRKHFVWKSACLTHPNSLNPFCYHKYTHTLQGGTRTPSTPTLSHTHTHTRTRTHMLDARVGCPAPVYVVAELKARHRVERLDRTRAKRGGYAHAHTHTHPHTRIMRFGTNVSVSPSEPVRHGRPRPQPAGDDRRIRRT